MLTAIAEVLGDTRGIGCPLHAQQRRDICRRGNHYRACPAFGAEDVFDKVFDLAATFADQPDDNHVGLGVTRHHAQQHAFTDAGAGEQPHALATADG
ncbi:hypothetical protein D3C73_1258980 [compost metagenome]